MEFNRQRGVFDDAPTPELIRASAHGTALNGWSLTNALARNPLVGSSASA